MCNDNRNLEEILTHGLIGVMGVDYDAFNAWATNYFQVTNDSWQPWGAFDPNDVARPFGKMLNAIFLIGYALSDNHQLQWHALEDYESLASGSNNRFHDHMYLRIILWNGTSEATSSSDRIDMHCPCFNEGSISNFPSHRAAVLLHEGWHHWQYKYDFDSTHPTGGACTWSQGDYYYFHGVGAYEFGSLHAYDTSPGHLLFHSPYQIEAEFWADLAELAVPAVPSLISQTARDHGNILLANAFVNPAPYRIGDPRPW
jgi:hypothetical protein